MWRETFQLLNLLERNLPIWHFQMLTGMHVVFFSSVFFFSKGLHFLKAYVFSYFFLLGRWHINFYLNKIYLKVFLIIFPSCPANEDGQLLE